MSPCLAPNPAEGLPQDWPSHQGQAFLDGSPSQESLNARFAGLTPSDFHAKGLAICATQTLAPPPMFDAVWYTINDAHDAGTEMPDVSAFPVVLILCDVLHAAEVKACLGFARAMAGCSGKIPPVLLVPHSPGFLGPIQGSGNILCSIAAEAIDNGIHHVITGDPKGIELAMGVRAKLALAEDYAGRVLEELTESIDEAMWLYLPARFRMALPMIHDNIDAGEALDISNLKFTVGEQLGSGAYASVWVLHQPGTGQNSGQVLRTIPKTGLVNVADVLVLKQQIEIMRVLSPGMLAHPNIVKLYGVHQSYTHICFRMEDAGSENLLTRMCAREENGSQCRPLSLATVKAIQMQAISGLEHLHRAAGVAHRDIKPENIVCSEADDIVIKLVGFDMATFVHGGRVPSKNVVGSLLFMAPEVWLQTSHPFLPTDIWSMGMVFSELLCGLDAVSRVLKVKYGTHQDNMASILCIHDSCRRSNFIRTVMEQELRPELQDLLGVAVLLLSGMLQVPVPRRWVAGQLHSTIPWISAGIPLDLLDSRGAVSSHNNSTSLGSTGESS